MVRCTYTVCLVNVSSYTLLRRLSNATMFNSVTRHDSFLFILKNLIYLPQPLNEDTEAIKC
jgi:hypothetical protein